MAMPHTLAGLIGFMIFVVFLFGASQSSTGGDTSEAVILQTQLTESINTTVSSENIFSGILNTVGTGMVSIQVIFGYVSVFLSKQGILGLPQEFNVFFLIVAVFVIVAVLNYIRGRRDV